MFNNILKYIFVASIIIFSSLEADASENDDVINDLKIKYEKEFEKASSIEDFQKIYDKDSSNPEVKYLAYISAFELMIESPTVNNFKAFNFAFPLQPKDLADDTDLDGDILFNGTDLYEGYGVFGEAGFVLQGVGRAKLQFDRLITGEFVLTPVIDSYDFDGEAIFIDQDPANPSFSEIIGDAFISYFSNDEMDAYCICKRIKVNDEWAGFRGTLWVGEEQYIGEFNENGDPHGKGKYIDANGIPEEVLFINGDLQ